jgi:hypothetical protein
MWPTFLRLRSESGEPSVDGAPIEAIGVVMAQDIPLFVFHPVEKILEITRRSALADHGVPETIDHERLRTALRQQSKHVRIHGTRMQRSGPLMV